MTFHSKIGASSMDRWSNCPGSVVLSEGIESRSSKYAEEGTAAHALGEAVLREKGPGGDVSAWVGKEFTYDDHGETKTIAVDEEMAEAVQVYVGHIHAVLQSAPIPNATHKVDAARVAAFMDSKKAGGA